MREWTAIGYRIFLQATPPPHQLVEEGAVRAGIQADVVGSVLQKTRGGKSILELV